jgi:DNA end-binding protein Ku
MARAIWKGFLKVGQVICPVSLYAAASTSDRVTFHTINRDTGHRVSRQFVDSETGKPVERDDQVKGYETGPEDFIILEPEEIAAAVPESDKTLQVKAFVACTDVDDVYFDKPYYLAPSDDQAKETFTLIREGLRKKKVAALAQTVLFRRLRTLLIRPHGDGLIGSTLNFDYEVRSADEAFVDMSDRKIEAEMLDLARHIISTKAGTFDPAAFEDRYDEALADLVKAKLEGRKIKPRPEPKPAKPDGLLAALRESAGVAAKAKPAKKPAAKPKADTPRRKAG